MRPGTHRRVAPGGAFPASEVEGVIGRGRRGAPGRGEGRKVGGPEGKGRDKDRIKLEGKIRWSRVRQGLCYSSVIKVFRLHESSGFVNMIDNSSNVDVIELFYRARNSFFHSSFVLY